MDEFEYNTQDLPLRTRRKNSTSYDVAKLAGVTQATVSRAINKPETVALETRTKIKRIMDSLNYKPSAFARGLVRGRSRVIGLLAHGERAISQKFGLLIEGLSEIAGADDYLLSIDAVPFPESVARLDKSPLIRQHACDGLIISLNLPPMDLLAFSRQLTIPHVLVNPGLPQSNDCVMPDDQSAAELAVQYLVAKGHRRIAYLTGSTDHASVKARERGYEMAMFRAGLSPMPLFNEPLPKLPFEVNERIRLRMLEINRRVDCWLDQPEPATAILTYDAGGAVHTSQALYLRGWPIPGRVSLMACDDELTLDRAALPITAVNLDRTEMGRQAARMLLEKIARPEKQIPSFLVKGVLVERKSVNSFPR
jgi:DNA-binding LacI/PurR family transcriptional regulator